MRAYEVGTYDAYGRLGIKLATASPIPGPTPTPAPTPAPTYAGPDGVRRTFWPSIGAHVRTSLIGRPSVYLDELKSGTAFTKGSYSRHFMWPVADVPAGASLWTKAQAYLPAAMHYGPLAYGLWNAATAPAEVRGSAVGGLVGHALGGMVGGPLGAVGSLGGSMLLGNLGSSLGSQFDSTPPRAHYHPSREGSPTDRR